MPLFVASLLAALSLSAAFDHCVYDAVSLDGTWEMAYCTNCHEGVESPQFAGVEVAAAVPGYWEDMGDAFRDAGMACDFAINPLFVPQTLPIAGGALDMTLPNIYGCFLYRRRVTLERAPARAVVAFEGVRNEVRVWANGTFVAARQGFSTPFELEIPSGVLRAGENEIVLAVSNRPNKGYDGSNVSGLTTRGVFASTGGVNGHVELRFPRNGLSDVYVTTAEDLKSFTVHLGDGLAQERRGAEGTAYEIVSSDGKIARCGRADGDFTLPTDGFEFWSPEHPVRYTLRIKTPEGVYSQQFGLRRLVADGEGLRLNGKPVYLRGVTEHCYYPETVHLPRDIGYYRRLTAKRKELGFNFVRFHTYVPPVEYLDAADELGMLVHIESPNFVTLDEYKAIVAFARRHPSVVIYCTGNETRIDKLAERYLRDVADVVHSWTDALFSPMSAMRGVEYQLMPGLDEIVETPFPYNPARLARLAAFCDLFTSYQLGATSYESLNGPSAATIDAWGDAYCGKPRLSHEICIDGEYLDLSLEQAYPAHSPIVKTGVFSGLRETLAGKGLLDRAAAYHRNSCEWMRRIRKFTFEKMRASRRTAGYDFLGDINTHWHTFGYSVGMMDEFLRLKPGETVENVLRYNSAAVLLSDLGSDFNVAAGERKRVAISISNFADDAKDATLRVSLVACPSENLSQRRRGAEDGVEVWAREVAYPCVPCGEVKELGEFEVVIPNENHVRKYLLRAKFASSTATAENEWEIYAFPKVTQSSVPKNVRAVDDISLEDLVAAMSRGERVLLLGAGPLKSLPMTFRIGLAGRCSGNYATVIKSDHPILAGLPNDGFCGWQFRRLMEDGRAVQLEAGIPFDPIIDIASSDKFPIRQSALFEYRVGEGQLLVCSFNFQAGDPAADWLKARLVEYASSDAFAPELQLTPEELRAVVSAPLLTGEANGNKARNPNDPASLVRAGSLAQP